ncbi:ATP-binding protein [Actinoplanes sp. NPDC049681]|uniref:ATP-binding protein n=1 Tax=Actinoplanes sp. NPDC049681 TaxID=3363905 RepID=UPI0037A648D0
MTAAGRHAQVQPLESPYLLTSAADRLGTGVAVTGDVGMVVVEVAVYGRWSPQLSEQVSAALHMCLAGPSAAIIVDLHDLGDPHGGSLPFWLALWRQARLGAAPVYVTFCLPTATALSRRLRYLQGPQPRAYTTLPEARAATAGRMSRADRLQIRLEPRPASVKVARTLVTRACRAWDRQKLLHDTWLIASELAANAVEHARTDFVVTVSRSNARLHVAIHDCVARFPHASELMLIAPQASLGERGRGLRLVHATAASWGTVPTHDGKVVWAAVI